MLKLPMAWFKKTRKPIAPTKEDKASRVPEGLWVKCPGCSQIIYNKDLATNLSVCPKCAHHFRISAAERLRMLLRRRHGSSTTRTWCRPIRSTFTDTKPYQRAPQGRHREHRPEGRGDRRARAPSTASTRSSPRWNTRFIGGSMGVVVGEKITRAASSARSTRR